MEWGVRARPRPEGFRREAGCALSSCDTTPPSPPGRLRGGEIHGYAYNPAYPLKGERRLPRWHFDHPEGRLIGVRCQEQRHRDVVNGNVRLCPTFERATMSMTVEHGIAAVSVDGFLQAARSEECNDLFRLAGHGLMHRGVVEDGNLLRCTQPQERLLELQRLLDRLVDEILDDLLAPRAELSPAETSGETLHSGETDAVNLVRVAVEHHHTDVAEDLNEILFLT